MARERERRCDEGRCWRKSQDGEVVVDDDALSALLLLFMLAQPHLKPCRFQILVLAVQSWDLIRCKFQF